MLKEEQNLMEFYRQSNQYPGLEKLFEYQGSLRLPDGLTAVYAGNLAFF